MSKRSSLAGAFILGAAIMAIIAYTAFDWRPFSKNVKLLKTDVATEYAGSMEIGQAEAKLTPMNSGQTAITVKFKVKNRHFAPIVVQATVALYDEDGFELGQRVVISTAGLGDFKVGEERIMSIDLSLPTPKARSLALAKILGRSLKTVSQIEEKRNALAEEERKKLNEIVAKNRQEKSVIAARWAQLDKGMSKNQVEDLLGKPLSVSSNYFGETWEYDGSNYLRSTVEFGREGILDSWNYR